MDLPASLLLGTRADLIFDINVLVQIAMLAILLMAMQQKVKKKYNSHGSLMVSALFLHLILVFTVMVPSWLRYGGQVFNQPLLGAIIITHSVTGTIAAAFAITIIIAWRIAPTNKMGCQKKKRLMLPTIVLWVISLILGIAFYIIGYVL